MSEPIVTSTSFAHSAPISKPHPHSVAYETVPPESRPVGSEEHGTTGRSDTPPGANEGEQYPPQIHAGKVGYGPHYADTHGNNTVSFTLFGVGTIVNIMYRDSEQR